MINNISYFCKYLLIFFDYFYESFCSANWLFRKTVLKNYTFFERTIEMRSEPFVLACHGFRQIFIMILP